MRSRDQPGDAGSAGTQFLRTEDVIDGNRQNLPTNRRPFEGGDALKEERLNYAFGIQEAYPRVAASERSSHIALEFVD